MAFLIRTIDITASGREIVRDRTVDKGELSIGRSSDNDIHLTDLAVEQHHVSMKDAGGGMLSVESVGGLGFGLDGRTVMSGTIDPNVGAEVSVGTARLAISREGDGPVQIVIKQVEKDEGAGDILQNFNLAAALPSKRTMAWVMAAAILVLLLSVPIVTHLIRSPVENDPDNLQQGQVMLDSAWSTGELSMKHHDLEENCEACHQAAFVSVQDETCLTCHEEIDDHADKPRQALGSPPMSTGDALQWSIAETLGKEGPLGCVSCHTEHEGQTRQVAAKEQFCSDCHGELDTRLTDVDFGNASDFGKKHPQFRPAIYTAHFADKPVRVSLDDKPIEESGLKFTHDEHLDTQGGVARMAISLAKYGAPLECSDCHSEWSDEGLILQVSENGGKPSDYGDFAPVVMEDACESCHSLVFDRAGPAFRNLRHGDVDDLMADLATMNRGPSRPTVAGRTRPGQFARGGTYYSNFGRPMSAYIAVNRALERDGVCGECHIPTTTNGRLDLTPVNLPSRFLWQGYFPHASHDKDANGKVIAECKDCHNAEQSSEATDLLIPDVESCRECHLGETALKTAQITPSGCAMCHAYHTPTAPWKPEDHPLPGGNGGKETVAAFLGSLRR